MFILNQFFENLVFLIPHTQVQCLLFRFLIVLQSFVILRKFLVLLFQFSLLLEKALLKLIDSL